MGGNEAAPLSLLELDADQTVLNGAEGIQAAAHEAIPVEGAEDGFQDPQAQPLAVAAIAGLMGGEGGRQVVPGEVVAKAAIRRLRRLRRFCVRPYNLKTRSDVLE